MRRRVAVIVVLIVIPLLTQSTLFFTKVHAETSITFEATAKEKLPTFLTQVLQIDLAQYNITTQSYAARYPSRFGGVVKEDSETYVLECNGSKIHVTGIFENGLISWLSFTPINGSSIIFSNPPSTDALVEAKNMFQRYLTYCQEFNLDSSHISSVLTMLNDVPHSPVSSGQSTNFNGMTNFPNYNVTSDNMMLEVSEEYIRASYVENGVVIRNKVVCMFISAHHFIFDDVWNLYHIGNFSFITQEEAQAIAFGAAKNFMATQLFGTDHGPELLNVTWSSRVDAGMVMIPGQSHNNTDMPIPPPDTFYNGNITRDPLGLYPLWQFIFYFNQSYGGVVGVQVAVWGDTKEIASCNEYGYLGVYDYPAPSNDNSIQTSQPTDNSTSALSKETSEPASQEPFPWLPLVGVSVTIVAVVALIAVVYMRKCKGRTELS